jgi:SAM-dependent methyltransferase
MYRKNIVSSIFLKARHGKTLSLLKGYAPGSAIDLGCDDGEFLARLREAFPEAKLAGYDMDSRAIAHARLACPGAMLHVSDFMEADIPRADLVVLTEVLEHAPDHKKMLGRAASLAKEKVLISIPRDEVPHWRLIWWLWSNTFGRRWKGQHGSLTEKQVIDSASSCGLDLEKKERFFLGTISLMLFRLKPPLPGPCTIQDDEG